MLHDLRTDHLPLKGFLQQRTLNAKVNNWHAELTDCNIKLKFIKGVMHCHRPVREDVKSFYAMVIPQALTKLLCIKCTILWIMRVLLKHIYVLNSCTKRS